MMVSFTGIATTSKRTGKLYWSSVRVYEIWTWCVFLGGTEDFDEGTGCMACETRNDDDEHSESHESAGDNERFWGGETVFPYTSQAMRAGSH